MLRFAIGSGKGGVGKSTVALNLALALRDLGRKVALFDADFYGPNLALMTGIARLKPADYLTVAARSRQRLKPMRRYGLAIQSAGFVLAEDQPNVLEAGAIEMFARTLLEATDWGDSDLMLVDLPPGTADIQQILMRIIPFTAAIVVVTPQDVAHLDARKAVQMYRKHNVEVVGAIENMSGLRCPHCGERIDVFPPVSHERSIWSLKVDKLGEVPLDPALGAAGDAGVPLLEREPESAAARAFRDAAANLVSRAAR